VSASVTRAYLFVLCLGKGSHEDVVREGYSWWWNSLWAWKLWKEAELEEEGSHLLYDSTSSLSLFRLVC